MEGVSNQESGAKRPPVNHLWSVEIGTIHHLKCFEEHIILYIDVYAVYYHIISYFAQTKVLLLNLNSFSRSVHSRLIDDSR